MSIGKMLVMLGGVLLVVAVLLLPIVSMGGSNLVWINADEMLDKILAFVTIAVGALAFLVVLMNPARMAIPLGVIALGVVGFEFFRVKGLMAPAAGDEAAAQMAEALGMGLAYTGWIALGAGALLVLVGGVMGMKDAGASAPPSAAV